MIVHFILSGETLQSISEEINLENPKYLKEFHNLHCAREDYIFDELIPGKRLLIPGHKAIAEYNAKNDAPFKAPELNPVLAFNPQNLNEKYFVEIIETVEKEEDANTNFITYNVDLEWMESTENYHIFQLSKNNFFNYDGSKMANLAAACMVSLNPLKVKTSLKGETLGISLPKKTVRDFNNKKEKLLDLFPDKYAGIYIEEFERAVLQPNIFHQRMSEDTFIKAFFAPVRNQFANGKSYFQQFIGEENIEVKVQQKVADINYTKEINLLQAAPSSGKDICYNGNYTLYTQNGTVKDVSIDYSISRNGVKNTTKIIIRHLI